MNIQTVVGLLLYLYHIPNTSIYDGTLIVSAVQYTDAIAKPTLYF